MVLTKDGNSERVSMHERKKNSSEKEKIDL